MVDRTDEETAELIREWLQQYGLTIITGVVLGVGILFAYRWWQDEQADKRSARSALVENAHQALNAQSYAQVLSLAQDDSLVGDTATLMQLLAAKAAVASSEQDKALTWLEQAANSDDELLAQTANWRLAQLHVAAEQFDQALGLIQLLHDGAYAGQAAMLEGYIYDVQGQLDKALEAYRRSHTLMPSNNTALLINAIEAKILTQQEATS